MARMNDNSAYPERWTTAKLFRELNKYANLESFSWDFSPHLNNNPVANANDVREVTRLYRKTWLQPIINELARRAKVEL